MSSVQDRQSLPSSGSRKTSPSAITGWSREQWAGLADAMLASVRPYASPGHARITLPGAEGGYGRAIDGLEGFARTFLLAGFRLTGECGRDPSNLAEWYAAGIAEGTDPSSPNRWVRLDEHGQAKVEAASIALILDMTRPWIWDRLTPRVQRNVIEYLSPAVGDSTYPRTNWLWFRLVVQTFLRSVGGPWSAADMAEDLALHDSFLRPDGWLADGEERSYDHYVGWALHLYPVLWARMTGAAEVAAPRRARDTAQLDRFLRDAVALVGADGSPLIEGRSLVYRFAAAAPFWVGAMAEVPSVSPGQLRRAASGVVGHFAARGAFDDRGLLTLGWFGPWPKLAQSYSGTGSPYWATKGMLGLALPADHPVWTAEEEELPVERADTLVSVRAPGWLVSGTRRDGIVRVVNHGTDHAVEGDDTGDSPLYAQLGYSTATSPLLDEEGWREPLEQSVVLVDAAGRATHRSGLRTLAVEVTGTGTERVGVAGSVAAAHWLDAPAAQTHHGSGYVGVTTQAASITTVSLVRGAWEVRLVRVDALANGQEAASLRLRIGGWAVAGTNAAPQAVLGGAAATTDVVASLIRAVIGTPTDAGTTARADASPLGATAVVPWLIFPVRPGAWIGALVELTGRPARNPTCTAVLDREGPGGGVTVTWPDDVRTRTSLGLTASK